MESNKITKTSTLLVASLASFLTPFMGSSVNVAIPAISSEFAANAIILSWIPAAYLLSSAMVAIPMGRIADIYGMKKIFIYGITIFTISSLGAAIAPSVYFLILSRVFQGIGSAMIFVTGLAIITAVFPPQEMGRAIAINITVIYIGLVLGPFLGGILTQYLGWRSIFFLMLPLSLLIIFITLWKLKGGEWAECHDEKFDLVGSLFYSLSLLLVLVGFSQISNDPIGKLMIIGGLIGFLLFTELRAENPVLNIKLFTKNRTFAFSNLATLISFTGTYAVVFLLSLYLQYIKGLDPRTTGLVLSSSFVFMALVSPAAGHLSDRYNPRKLASLGMMLITLGMFIFVFLDSTTSVYQIILGLTILGIGSGIFSSPNTTAIMSSVKPKYFGVASATVSTMRLIGQALSMGMVLFIFSIYLGSVQINPDNYSLLLMSVQITFIIATVLCFIAIFASLARGSS